MFSLLLLSLWTSLWTFAGSNLSQAAAVWPPHGAALLSQTEAQERLKKYEAIERLEAKFEQTKKLTSMGLTLRSSGSFVFQKPDRVEWKVEMPAKLNVILQGETVTLDSSGDVQKFDAKESQKLGQSIQSLKAWLKMDVALLAQDYEIAASGRRDFYFSPKEQIKSSLPFSSIYIHLYPVGYVERLELFEKSGDLMEVRFTLPQVKP